MVSFRGEAEVKMTCREVQERLSAWLDGELAPPEGELIAAHLLGCDGCRREVAQFRALDAALAELVAPVPLHLAEKVAARLQGQPDQGRRPWWQSLAMVASLVLGIVLGGSLARDFYPLTPQNGVAEVATLQDFHDFPQGSLGTILASYQPEEGNGT
jgi:anti-sigma factor RsiW